MCYFFFVKQKTAYEMRISDWSSDVCSSDLIDDANVLQHRKHVGDAENADDLVVLELHDREPVDLEFVAGWLNTHIRSANMIAVMGGVDPDLVLALAEAVVGLVSSREEGLCTRDRRRFCLFIGAEIGRVRGSVPQLIVKKLIHRIKITAVKSF